MESDPETDLPDDIDVYRVLAEVHDVVIVIGREPGRLDYVSPAFEEVYGVSPDGDRVETARVLDRVHPEDRDRIDALFEEITAEPVETRFEHRLVDGTGGERWVEIHLVPVHDDEGDVAAVGGVISDVTERKRREQELVMLHRLLRHDVRNGLAVVTGWLDVLGEDNEDDREVIDRLERASSQMLQLTADTRDAMQVASGGGRPDLEPTPVKPILQSLLAEKRELFPDAEFEVEGSVPDVAVSANALLATVLRNIVRNAVQHNDEPTPVVTVSVEERAETVRISVADNGPGVPEQRRDRLFQMGEKGPESTGSGLGLYLCRRIVDSYDGDVWYEPNEPEGSIFHVELPLSA
jgi:PAS domain S-box-containing protein